MCLVCLVNGAPFSMGRGVGSELGRGRLRRNGVQLGAAGDGGLAAGSVAWLTTVLRRKPAASRTMAARRAAYGRSPSSSSHVRSPRFFLS